MIRITYLAVLTCNKFMDVLEKAYKFHNSTIEPCSNRYSLTSQAAVAHRPVVVVDSKHLDSAGRNDFAAVLHIHCRTAAVVGIENNTVAEVGLS